MVLKEYGETIRYYVICEYGTQSFRPHYHILLFHDSPRARADFRIVRTLPQSTKENPREVCVKLDLAELWVYGDTTTKVTDGNMQEYVSKYLTQHSDFPQVLDKFPQRCFHSILLGSKDRNEVRELLKTRDFETLTTDYVVNKKGVRRPVSQSRYGSYKLRASLPIPSAHEYLLTNDLNFAVLLQSTGFLKCSFFHKARLRYLFFQR